jgi:hypothetical protein
MQWRNQEFMLGGAQNLPPPLPSPQAQCGSSLDTMRTDEFTCKVDDCNLIFNEKNAWIVRTHLNSKHNDIAAKVDEIYREEYDDK